MKKPKRKTRAERIHDAIRDGAITRIWGAYLIKRRASHKTLDAALYLHNKQQDINNETINH